MSAQQHRRTAADDEAADWIARLGTRTISLETVHAFAEWRKDPANAEAYDRAEQLWSRTGTLGEDAEIKAAVAGAFRRPPSRRSLKPLLTLGIAAAVAASLSVSFFVWQGQDLHQTGVGEQKVLQLSDGSRVQLDTGSRIRVRYSDGERRIELDQGQAYFEVAHDADRPFVVSTLDASVTAVGTVFEVRRVEKETRVVLVSGAVDVRQSGDGAAPRRLKPNQETAIRDRRARVTTVDARASTSWTSGELTFSDTPLSEAVAEMNRYLTDPIILDAPAAAGTSINGVFRSGDRAAFVSAAAQLLNLKVVNEPNGQVRLVGSRNNSGG